MRGVLLERPNKPIILDPVEALSHRPGGHRILADLNRAAELAGPFEPRGSLNTWQETLRAEIQDGTAVANTTTETILVPDVVLPPRYLMATGRTLRARIRGRYSTTSTPTITIRQRIGGVAGVAVVASAAFTLPTTITNVPFEIEIESTVRSEGSAGTMFGMGTMTFATAAPNTAATQYLPASAPAVSSSIDMTAQQNHSITITWGTASASNTITAHLYQLESMN